jgi:methylmalonyl-CoA mutase cobalamin-binding subunit
VEVQDVDWVLKKREEEGEEVLDV